MLIINQLFPVFAIITLGGILKHFSITSTQFLATSDRLIYFIFFPALLFWKIGGAGQVLSSENMRFYIAALGAVTIMYTLSLAYILLFRVPKYKAGTFSQTCYRFNTYIGMAVILTTRGEEGAAQFGVLIAMAIPLINIMAVTTLIWFSEKALNWRQQVRRTLYEWGTNPLILGCLAGLAYARYIGTFPSALDNTLRLGTTMALPMALLSIGGNLTLKNIPDNLPLVAAGSIFKLVALPFIGWMMMRFLDVATHDYPIGMLFFSLPTSTAIFVLSSQLNSDTDLASASIVISTALSFFSMSAVLWWFF